MATEGPPRSGERLPIKLIMPNQGIERPVIGGGGAGEPFRDVDKAYRQRLDKQVEAVIASAALVQFEALFVKILVVQLDECRYRVQLFNCAQDRKI